MRVVLGHVNTLRSMRATPQRAGAARRRRTNHGRMPIILTIYGGDQALSEVLEGLVQRNERSIREGAVPAPSSSGLTPDFRPGNNSFSSPQVWRDAVSALADRHCSIGTMATYRAAAARLAGKPASVGFVGGVPTVAYVEGGQVMGYEAPIVSTAGPDAITAPRGDKVEEYMYLTLDDDKALPVCEVNTAIAHHNARQIKERRLPGLYSGAIHYETEGSPELWWDAQKIAIEGHDDCEGLAAYRAGELIGGLDPSVRGGPLDSDVYCRLIEPPGGSSGRLFHAVTRVMGQDGRIEWDDPSARLGMKRPRWYLDFCRKMRAEGRPL